ncbi:MAG: ABC transporter permease, partial [Dehalococcoidia bacterium]
SCGWWALTMNKVWLITRHEFQITTSRTSFRLVASIVPVLAVLGLLGAGLFQAISDDGPRELVTAGFVDPTVGPDGDPIFNAFFEQGEVTFAPHPDIETAIRALLRGRIDLLYVIPEDFLSTGVVQEIKAETSGIALVTSGAGSNLNTTPLGQFILNNLFVGAVGTERAQRVLVPYTLTTTEVDETGVVVLDELDRGRLLLFLGIAVLLVISIFTTTSYLLQGLNEEKESRVMEVLLSSVKPEQLMLGKLLGLGAAGLTQMAIWTLSGVGFVIAYDAFVGLPAGVTIMPSPGGLAIALLYFVLGYFFYGTLMAALGAVTTSQREAGQVTFLMVLPGVAPLWVLPVLLQEPEGTLARTLSFIPFSAPLVGLLRVGVDGMSTADLIGSLAALAIGVALATLFTLRLFRAYLLMSGQRPSLGHILRTVRGA